MDNNVHQSVKCIYVCFLFLLALLRHKWHVTYMLQYFLASLLTSIAAVVDGSFAHWRYREYPTYVPLPEILSYWETRTCKNATSLSSFSGEIWKLILHDSSEIPVWDCTAIIRNKNPLSNTLFYFIFSPSCLILYCVIPA